MRAPSPAIDPVSRVANLLPSTSLSCVVDPHMVAHSWPFREAGAPARVPDAVHAQCCAALPRPLTPSGGENDDEARTPGGVRASCGVRPVPSGRDR